jgi:hypothetical protein
MPDTTSPEPAASAPVESIIRRLEYAEETSNERLLKKHLPAWVISGALNLSVVTTALIIDKMTVKTVVQASDAVIETALEEKADDTKPEDLTNTDKGLDSDIPLATNSDIKADVTIEAPDAPSEPVGTPAAKDATPMDFTAPPGVGPDLANAGFAGDTGMQMMGAGGANGNVVNAGMLGRSGATKDKLIREGGGNAESERAVALGLAWLAKQQRQNGSWVFDGSNAGDVAASTGLALLPFFAAGQTHKPPQNARIDYHLFVERGLNFLLSNQDPATGKFRGISNMYGQGIATVALCEAYGMTGDKSKLLAAAQKAVNYIQRVQGSDGSWNYSSGNGDTSIVGWQIQALKSAQLCKDIVVDKQCLDRARGFLVKIAGNSKQETYGYSLANPGRPTPGTALTAIGLLCRYYTDWGAGDVSQNESFVNGSQGLFDRSPPRKANMNMYYYYYATQVVHFLGGELWHKKWNPAMRDMLIELQSKQGVNLGSWDPGNDRWMGSHTGRLGMTCMSLLTLEVYYRHLPLNKRDAGGARDVDRLR